MYSTEAGEKRRIFLEIMYIIILAASVMGDMKGFSDSTTRMMKAISVLIVVMGSVMLFVSGRIDRVKTAGRFVGLYGFILIGIIVWSIFLWIINLETIEFITRGVSKFMFQFLVLLIIFAAVYMFGERAIYTTFYGLALANTVILIINLGTYGFGDSVNSVVAMVTGADIQSGFTRAMEIHDVTFTYGFYIIYFLFFAQHNKERNICLIIGIFYFMLGWKRIAFLALPVAVVLALMLGRMKPQSRVSFMKFTAWFLVIAAFSYVLITRYGLFEKLTDFLKLDSMGRNEVYDYIKKYYEISIGFIGYGFEYTTVLLQRVVNSDPDAHIGVLALHNNILTIYIELGFIGFWAWMVYTLVFQLNWMLSHWDEKTAMLFFLCEIYIFITYTTDNTLYYYYTSMSLRLMPMAYAFHRTTEQDIKLWPWVKARQRM